MKEILQAGTTASNNASLSGKDLSKTEVIAWHSAFTVQAVFILVGNGLTIVLFAMNKNLRKKSLYLVINMAFADMMFGAMLLCFIINFLRSTFQLWATWYQVIQLVFSQASLISAVFISFERFYAIYRPLKHRTLSMRAYRIAIIMVWTLAILFLVALVLTLLKRSATVYFVLSICTLFLLFIVCGLNIAIWRKFHHGSIASHQQNRASQNQRLTKTLLFVSVAALVSWLPIIIYNFLIHIFKLFIPVNIYNITLFLFYSNCFVNPLVYALRIPEFKQALGLCCVRRQAVMNKSGNEESADNWAAA